MGKTEKNFRVPDFLNVPWLTYNYVLKHGFSVELPRSIKDLLGKAVGFKNIPLGKMPVLPRTEIRAGGILIFDEYFEFEDACGYCADRFDRIAEKDTQEHLDRKRGMLPAGIVVHHHNDFLRQKLFNLRNKHYVG